jgi:hypothetical protein
MADGAEAPAKLQKKQHGDTPHRAREGFKKQAQKKQRPQANKARAGLHGARAGRRRRRPNVRRHACSPSLRARLLRRARRTTRLQRAEISTPARRRARLLRRACAACNAVEADARFVSLPQQRGDVEGALAIFQRVKGQASERCGAGASVRCD